MLLTVFEKYLFLQSLGWGIANSFWQAALLWSIYKLVIASAKNLSALSRYHLGLLLLFASCLWFGFTVLRNYLLLQHSGADVITIPWLAIPSNFITSLQYVSVIYLLLLLLHTAQLLKNLKGLQQLRNSQFTKAPVAIRIFTVQTALHIGITKKVTVWLSEKVDVPSVIGFFKPVILLPVTALSHLSTAQAEAVILHELAHIRRNDYLINLIQSFVETLLFFNPFARMLGKAVAIERENCCDDWVLNYRYDKHDYASALLQLEQNRLQPVKLALAATNGKKNLLTRVKRLFVVTPQVDTSLVQKIKISVLAVSMVTFVLSTLPVLQKRTGIQLQEPVAAGIINALPLRAAVAPSHATGNLPEKKITAVNLIKPVIAKTNTGLVTLSVKVNTPAPVLPGELTYERALVNEDLLNTGQLQDMVVQVAEKDSETPKEMIVKIEEEQSGAKDKNTYVFQLKNNNGTTEVTPLILLNKKWKAPAKNNKAAAAKADSLRIAAKTRITS